MIKLSNSIKVLVPVNDNDGVRVDLTSEVKSVIEVAGGATNYLARGSWVDGGKLYNDNLMVVQFNTAEFSNDLVRAVNNLVYAIFLKAEQLAVSVEVNGTLYILESIDDMLETFSDIEGIPAVTSLNIQ